MRNSTPFWTLSALLAMGVAATVPTRAETLRPHINPHVAWQHLLRQVEFGPRVPNRSGHANCLSWIVTTLESQADSVARQDFTRNVGGRRLRMTNVIARWRGAKPNIPSRKGVLLCAHWDTRPTADNDPDRTKRKQPIPGANDGASGVAVLLEMARVLHDNPPPVPVMIVLFDGEDYGPSLSRMFLGSRYFAAHLPRDVPRRGVLLDMVGDKQLAIPQEENSRRRAPKVTREVYATARRLGLQAFFPSRRGPEIRDDHLPLLKRGLKVIDLIDFSYGPSHSWWHTMADTTDKCSPDSLQVVGDVVAEWLYAL